VDITLVQKAGKRLVELVRTALIEKGNARNFTKPEKMLSAELLLYAKSEELSWMFTLAIMN
jgi:hypothetical protein